ncbi:hypothetical protein MARU1_002331 [Malassezia arunalokei]|uniref:Uncharacterized protein n=1 Tax=Malassezia arunalokei TaxID=1514897 RepID=A0AAJ6CM49_9BASI|nr:hypothetical protein MARU1_002331 [Malassezia arunalokei]
MFRSLIALAFLAVPSVMAVAAGKGSNLYCFKPIKDVSNPAYAWEVDFDKTEEVCRTLSSDMLAVSDELALDKPMRSQKGSIEPLI